MKNIYEAIKEKCNRRDYLQNLIKQNKYPKKLYKKIIKELDEIKDFFYKYGRDIY